MAVKKKQPSFTVQIQEKNQSLQKDIAALKTKVRKLQAENRKLQQTNTILNENVNHKYRANQKNEDFEPSPDMNAELVSTDVDTKGESHADTEEIESVAPINTQGGTN